MSDDDLEDFLALVPNAVPKPRRLPLVETPEATIQALQRKFPTVPQDGIHWFVSGASKLHIDAALRPLSRRNKYTLSLFLRGHGEATSADFVWEDGHDMGGNFVFLNEIRREGFVIQTTGIKHGSAFTLDLKDFNEYARRRIPLSKRRREAILAFYGYECQRCGSTDRDGLQADHRAPIFAGRPTTQNEAFLIVDWQPLCGSCNSLKSHHCEACAPKDPSKCVGCFWANPKDHTHKAGDPGYWFDGGKLPKDIPAIARKAGMSPHEWVQRLLLRAVQHVLAKETPEGK